MDIKLIGGILLIIGTSIGAGMLALPVATASLGFLGSLALLVTCWLVMTVSAFLLLEVNLWLFNRSNIISMAGATIGPLGQMIAWVSYLLLLYSLLCAYIAGGSDLFQYLLSKTSFTLSANISAVLFTLLFSVVVYLGIHAVDYLNRGLMIVKLSAYLVLIILLLPFISTDYLIEAYPKAFLSSMSLTVTITSFGFAIIIPSLRVYFHSDVKKLRRAILIGSLIPLVCYIAWDAAIMGVIPFAGDQGLATIVASDNTTSHLVSTLTTTVSTSQVTFFANLFTSICVLTSFLGVALCLTDFLADGLSIERRGSQGWIIYLITFIPPLVIVLLYPNAFVTALEYAGIYCIILLILLPAWMAWRGRAKFCPAETGLLKGRLVPGLLFCIALAVLIKTGIDRFIPSM